MEFHSLLRARLFALDGRAPSWRIPPGEKLPLRRPRNGARVNRITGASRLFVRLLAHGVAATLSVCVRRVSPAKSGVTPRALWLTFTLFGIIFPLQCVCVCVHAESTAYPIFIKPVSLVVSPFERR